jgi:predicted RNA-binding Zn ribbon-like protein
MATAPLLEAHVFGPQDFVGGDPVLDFVNTVTGRNGTPRDWIVDHAALLDWAARVELLPPSMLATLRDRAHRRPRDAAAALARAKALREALFDVFSASSQARVPAASSLDTIQRLWRASRAAYVIAADDDGGVDLRLDPASADFDLIAWVIALEAVQRVFHRRAGRLRMCEGADCAWWFIDTSKAGRRRWCDMAVCGNTAKAKRFKARRTSS